MENVSWHPGIHSKVSTASVSVHKVSLAAELLSLLLSDDDNINPQLSASPADPVTLLCQYSFATTTPMEGTQLQHQCQNTCRLYRMNNDRQRSFASHRNVVVWKGVSRQCLSGFYSLDGMTVVVVIKMSGIGEECQRTWQWRIWSFRVGIKSSPV